MTPLPRDRCGREARRAHTSAFRRFAIRHVALRAEVLVFCAATILPLAASHAQTPFYVAGLSTSWGEKSAVICMDTDPPVCSEGEISSHQNFLAPTAGVVVSPQPVGPLRFESGAVLAPKGWAVTAPTLQVVYLEIPLIAHVGYWPNPGNGGGSILAGLAADLDVLNPGRSDVALVWGVEFQGATASGSRWSGSVRYARGLNTIYSLQNHALTLLVGFSPARRREP